MKSKRISWRQMLSLLLVIVLVVQIMPIQVLAAEWETDSVPTNEEMVKDTADQESGPIIIGEVKELREEDTKHFMNTDGSFTAVKYSVPVHFKDSDDSQWLDIDNTLSVSKSDTKSYAPTSSPIDVSFANNFSKSKTVTLHNKGYELSWSYLQPDVDTEKTDIAEAEFGLDADNAMDIASLTEEPTKEKVIQAKKLELDRVTESANTNEKYTRLDKLMDGLVYSDVFPDVDIEYILDSVTLKENIILKNRSAQNEFIAQYNIGDLTAKQMDEQNIELLDSDGETVFCISAPCMFDANSIASSNVVLSIVSEEENVLKVKITADKEWLHDSSRVYPVKIDPDILKFTQSFDEDATAIFSQNLSDRPYGSLVIGNDLGNEYEKAKAYVKFSLPTLGAGDMVVNGQLHIYQFPRGQNNYGYSGSIDSLQINAYRVTSSWTAGAIESSHGYLGLPSVDTTVIDYFEASAQTCNNIASFDVSKAVKMWYEGEATNYGLCLCADDESAYAMAIFAASNNQSINPVLQIVYRNNKGLEAYWSNHTQNLGESGIGYVNDYTGNLVYIAPLVSTTGNIMPVSLSLVYNGYQHGSNIDRPNTVGKGWRLNIQQKLTPITRSGGLNTDLYDRNYRYIYSDSDGTEHYFYVDPHDSSKFLDEDGLGLTVTVNSTVTDLEKYVITSDDGGKMTFTSSGYLRKVYDENGNFYKILYSDEPDHAGEIIRVEDGVGRRIVINRYPNGRIKTLTQQVSANGTTTRTVTLHYSDWDGLSSISYPDGRTTSFYYTDSGLKLNRIYAISGNSLKYTYPTTGDAAAKSRVIGITEYGSAPDREEGNSLTISYDGINRTKFTDNRNRSETYQFDNFGRTVGIIDAAGNGSQYNYSDTSGKTANTLSSTGVATKFVDNRLLNHSFENQLTSWSHDSDKVSTDSTHYYYGTKSGKLEPEGYVSQKVSKNPYYTYYTSSVYARGSSGNSKIKFNIYFYDSNGTYLSSKSSEQDLRENVWDRKQFTFTLPNGAEHFWVRYVNCGTDNIWIDCAQLENGATMNRYNMVQNSDFENTASTAWTTAHCDSSDNYCANETYGRCFHMTGIGSADKRITQKIYINKPANKVFLSISGYAKANSVPMDESGNRRFALSVGFHCTDGSESYEYIPFNDDYSAGWQYASGTVGVKEPGNKTVDYVYIRCCYYKNANNAYFDRIQVNIDESGTCYTYDEDGNLTSAKDNAGRHETYYYTSANEIETLTATDNKVYDFTYSDTYKHRMLSATSQSSGVKYEYTYGDYGHADQGNVTGVKVSSTNPGYQKYIKQTNKYTENGNYPSVVYNDRGYSTEYNYGEYTGNLYSVRTQKTSASGSNTTYYSTYYTYQPYTDRLLTVCNSDTDSNSKVSYGYDEQGHLTSIVTPSTVYNFTYDNFGNSLQTKAGNNTLVTNTYEANNGRLTRQTYGNGYFVSYVYDDLDREKSRAYNGNTKYWWSYNADGNVASHTDNYMNQKFIYTYDNIGRLVRTNVYDSSSSSNGTEQIWFRTDYNKLDQSTSLHYKFYTRQRDIYFGYSSRDNLPEYVRFGTNSQNRVTNRYDELTRLSGKAYALTGANYDNIVVDYGYLNWSTVENRTSGTVKTIKYNYGTFDDNNNEVLTDAPIANRSYGYDRAGNITAEYKLNSDDTTMLLERYTYDGKNQLVRHDSATQNKTFVYEYNAAGNITQRKEYAYTTSSNPSNAINTVEYGYDEGTWGDLLTSYDGTDIEYDTIGNPTSYRGWSMTWDGRRLATASKGTNSLSYTYNADGIRTSKTVNGTKTEYLLNGTQILAQKTGSSIVCFFYDSQGNRVGLADASNHVYYYIYNLQGDVIAIADAVTGGIVGTYSYDAWGKCTVGAGSSNIATLNPFRYRGYYFDSDTGLYYLNSRYYDPGTGRFISADSFATTDVSGVLSANTFSYCENNPIVRSDQSGELFATISGAIIGGVAGAIGAYLNGDNILAGALTGAVNGGTCGFVAEATALTGGIALAFCAGIGMACETANQVANGKTLRTMDHCSVVLSGAFSAMSYGLCKGVESLMGDASEAVKNFVTTIRGASTALVGVGASNIHNDNQKRKGAAILDCWSRRENHYRRWATR